MGRRREVRRRFDLAKPCATLHMHQLTSEVALGVVVSETMHVARLFGGETTETDTGPVAGVLLPVNDFLYDLLARRAAAA